MTGWQKNIVNRIFRIPLLMKKFYDIDIDERSSTFRCPFPAHGGDDKHKSAQYFSGTNQVFCYTERRIYSPFDLLIMNGVRESALIRIIASKDINVCQEQPLKRSIEVPLDKLKKSCRLFRKGRRYSETVGNVIKEMLENQ